jgi:WD40 repeat protein
MIQQQASSAGLGVGGVNSPYPGLRPFRREESIIFFGRDRQVDQMLELLRRVRFLGVVGSSGCGKSSLVKAGLFPALHAGFLLSSDVPWSDPVRFPNWVASRWFTVDMRPGAHPFRGFARGLMDSGLLGDSWDIKDPGSVPALAARLQAGPRQLLKLWQQAEDSPSGNLLILADQFEELFRFRDGDNFGLAQSFVSSLLQFAAQDDWPIYVAITMRSDFLGECSQFQGLPEALNKGQFLVPRLATPEIRDSIERPARMFGVELDPLLLTRLLNDIGNDSDQLPLLQHALKRTWDLSRSNGTSDANLPSIDVGVLSLADYDRDEIGGVSRALDRHIEEVYAKLSGKDENDGDKRIARVMFQALTLRDNGRDIRRPTKLGVVAQIADVDDADVTRIVDVFRAPDCCFLTPPLPTPLTSESILDISHESLIRQWRTLQTWIVQEAESAANYQRLVDAVRSQESVLEGLRLDRAVKWREAQRPTNVWAMRFDGAKTPEESLLAQCISLIATSVLARTDRESAARKAFEEQQSRAEREREHLRIAQLAQAETQRAQEAEAAAERQRKLSRIAYAATGMAVILVLIATAFWRVANLRELEARIAADRAQENLAQAQFAFARGPLEQGKTDDAMLWWALSCSTSKSPSWRASMANLIGGWSATIRHTWPHEEQLTAVALSQSGEIAISATRDGTVRLWDIQSGAILGSTLKHEDVVSNVVLSPDGQSVLTASDDKTARLWDARTGKAIGILKHDNRVQTIAFSPDGRTILTGSDDNTARLWDATTSLPRGKPLQHDDKLNAVRFSPDGSTVLTSSANAVRLWDAGTGQPLGQPMLHESRVLDVSISPDGQTVVTGSDDNTARLWDMQTNSPRSEPLRHEGSVRTVAFSPDGKTVATGSVDQTARLWDANTGLPRGEPWRHKAYLWVVSFSPNGEMLLTGCDDNSVWLWDVDTGTVVGRPLLHEDVVESALFSPDGRSVLTCSGAMARLWSFRFVASRERALQHEGRVTSVAFSPDGRTVLTGSTDDTARLWDAQSGAESQSMLRHNDEVTSVAFSPDGHRVLTGCRDKVARLWDVRRNAELVMELQHNDDVTSVAFSPNGQSLLTGCRDKTARIWNVDGQKMKLLSHMSVVNAVSFSADGKIAITGSGDAMEPGAAVNFWNSDSGVPAKEPSSIRIESPVLALAISRDGQTLVTGGGNRLGWGGELHLWDIRSSPPRGDSHWPGPHDRAVGAVSFSPDGQTIVFGSDDGTAYLYDVRTGNARGAPLRHEGAVTAVAFGPDGQMVLTGSDDARLWDVPPPAIDIRDSPERLRLSVEVRTGKWLDENGVIKRLTLDEWLQRRKQLDAMGGPCDAPTWPEYNAWKATQSK